jgi:hypothetical protein
VIDYGRELAYGNPDYREQMLQESTVGAWFRQQSWQPNHVRRMFADSLYVPDSGFMPRFF